MKKIVKQVVSLLTVATLIVGMSACSSSSSSDNKSTTAASTSSDKKTIKIGSIAYNQDEVLAQPAIDKLKEEGYEVESLVFENATVMNEAIQEGSLDATLHEHQPWLDAYNKANGTDLVMLTPYIHYNQFSLMSDKYDKVEDIPDGAEIVVSDDSANQARGLLFLQELGLIKLKDGVDFPTTLDVTENPHNFKLTVVQHHQVVKSLQDVDACLTSTFLLYSNGGGEDEIVATSKDLTDYGVGFVVRSEDKDSDWAKALVDAYSSKETSDEIAKIFNGGFVPGYDVQNK